MSRLIRALCAASAAVAAFPNTAHSQTAIALPTVEVQGTSPGGGSLTVPDTARALEEINRIPGAVEVVPDTAFKDGPAQTVKDIVDYVPGVWAQPKWGDDTRLSIRGSGISRNFHLRGVQLYMDGIPINTSDGYGDFQEIDPTAYRYVEIFKGANALRFGANSMGGAINFVTPTGYNARQFDGRLDAGGFGFLRGAVSSGGVYGQADYFAAVSAQQAQGFRDHSSGEGARGFANVGYRFSPTFETRLYVNANSIRQDIPGEVTKYTALHSPQTAWTDNVVNDWQRNIDTGRIASKSTLKLENTTVDFGAYGIDRHLMHPIFQWLDYRYKDYGGFVRAVDERSLWGFRNRLTAGANILNGTINADQYANVGGNKGAQLSSLVQKPENYSIYAENAFYVMPTVSLVAGTQYLYAVRDQTVNFSLNGDVDGRSTFSLWSPKGGFVWDVDPTWQVFANVSRSAEVPSFGEGGGASSINFTQIKAQTATTYEIGTRGRRPDYTWDLALYRANIENELQCFFSAFGNCNVTNADKTFHQGIEAGVGLTLFKGLTVLSGDPDRVWLNVAYTYSDFRYDNDPVFGDNRLPGAPEHFLRAELLYKHPSGFSFGPNIEWVPVSYYVDSANTLTTEPYLLWGLTASYDNGKDFSFYVEGRNLSDVNYISSTSIINEATAQSRLFNPGDGRAVFAGARWQM